MKLANGKTLTDDQLDRRLGRQYRRIEKMHADGACDHPASIPSSQWAGILRGTRAATTDEDAPDDGDDLSAQAKLAAGHANDAAPREGIPMSQAFKGFTHNGPTQR